MPEEPRVSQEATGSYIVQATDGGQASIHVYTSPSPQDKRERLDREQMLCRLRRSYQELLDQSLRDLSWVALGLATRADLVSNVTTTTLLFRFPHKQEQLLPAGTSMLSVYEKAAGELLILGAPGAGKSTLLLDLAVQLVDRAQTNEIDHFPVILNLSSWATQQLPLTEWMAEQLSQTYGAPHTLSERWVTDGRVLPLLDGLDEMQETARPACIAAINTYHHEHLAPLVVCSRQTEYEGAVKRERLALQSAVIVQPLSNEQIEDYLSNTGPDIEGVRDALQRDQELWHLATTPLMLSVLLLTYKGKPPEDITKQGMEWEQQIWTDYVARMTHEKGNEAHYSLEWTQHWLCWMARQMRQHNQVIFSLEQLRADWLPKEAYYQWSITLSIGLLTGLIWWLSTGLLTGLFFGLSEWLFGGWWKIPWGRLELEPVEKLTWSWKQAQPALRSNLVHLPASVCLIIVEIGGIMLIAWLLGQEPRNILTPGFIIVLTLLAWLVIVALIEGLMQGWSTERLTERLTLLPNEGIRRSIANGFTNMLLITLLLLLTVGLLWLGLVIVQVNKLVSQLPSGLLIGGLGFSLITSLCLALVSGLSFGLGAVLQHYTMRFWLAYTHTFPLHAVPFLNDATSRILLRRVGGGYAFIHRRLQDYFADLPDEVP